MSLASPARVPTRAEGSTTRLAGVEGFRAIAVLVYHN